MFDTAIIGTGPAGISAALTLRSLKKDFVWFGSRKLSEKIRVAEKIRNYPGLIQVSGEEMQQAFSRQLEEAGIADDTVIAGYQASTATTEMVVAAQCAAAFDRLPLVQDKAILDNILYSGIWVTFRTKRKEQNAPGGNT